MLGKCPTDGVLWCHELAWPLGEDYLRRIGLLRFSETNKEKRKTTISTWHPRNNCGFSIIFSNTDTWQSVERPCTCLSETMVQIWCSATWHAETSSIMQHIPQLLHSKGAVPSTSSKYQKLCVTSFMNWRQLSLVHENVLDLTICFSNWIAAILPLKFLSIFSPVFGFEPKSISGQGNLMLQRSWELCMALIDASILIADFK